MHRRFSMGKYGKKNHISLNVLDASVILMGTLKLGKSTLLKEVAEKVTNPNDGYMFLEMYHENGASKIEGINYENVPNWEVFDDIISDIEDNKSTDYPNLKLVVIDTWDNAIEIAEKEVIRVWNKNNPNNRTDNINATYAGWNRGQEKASQYLEDMTQRLLDVGVQVWIIMHLKNKEISDPISGETYQTVTANISQKYFNNIGRNKDVIAVGYVDRQIVKEHKNGKDKNIIKGQTRKIKFHDDNYTIDAGGRLSDCIVSEIPFTSDAFIKAIEDALKAKVEKAGVSLEDRAKEDKQRAAEREKQIAEAEKKHNEEKELQDILTQIKEFIENNKKDNLEAIKKLVEKARELGYENPVEIDVLSDAKKIFKLCK